MKTIVLLFILVCYTPQLLAADVFENFNNGSGGFSESTQFSVSNKRFEFQGNRGNTSSFTVWGGGSNQGGWAAKPENSNYFTDFNASVDTIWLDGNNSGYGINVCVTENRFGNADYVRFLINGAGADRYFVIDAKIDGDYKELQKWTKNKSLITENKSNKLSIAKSGNEFRFYINYTEVKRLVINGCAGGAIGVEASDSLDAAFDNFEIKDLSSQETSNQPPKASFTLSPRQGNAPFTVSLNASSSFDPDGSITSYQWSASDGQTANGKNSQLTFNNAGTYAIILTVTDDKGATNSVEKTITVNEPKNQDPKASFTMSSQGNTVSLNASSSFDPDGSITAYQWSSSNGQAANGKNSQLTFPNPGTYEIILTVTDDKGATNSTHKIITLNQQNQPPQANFTMSPNQGDAPLTVILNASSSFDPDGSITSYQWSSSDGQAANSQNTQFIFNNPGTYTISLTVTDDKGETAQITKTVTVTTADITPTTNNENVAELKFIGYEPLYQVGDMLMLNLQAKIIKNRNQRVDLWISIQLPAGGILYMTPKITQLFSTKAQPFITSIERIDETYRILQLQVPEDIGGNYTLSAIFIKEGKNFITGGPTVIKSNIAIAEIVLSNR
ncbi:PKD domain-containing protein [Candidatus Marithrix sp. Canyon 246]|uniref:PKD domain-containing protein n=3 Tax=Candidatus Marithrix sp. Canyon 246 TaxID=1827136 RepID=UPI000849ED2F|nr:PKD domain-containing protein [Candidatus Marithrix sp. Canyon 246]